MNEPAMRISEEPAYERRRKGGWGALQSRNFRLFWIGLAFANLGYWMQITTICYLFVNLSANTAQAGLWLGAAALAQALPMILLAPVAGVITNLFPRRTILWNSSAASAIVAVILAVIMETKIVAPPILLLLALLAGVARSLDNPARQSWVPKLVPHQYERNALALSALTFYAGAAAGPIIAALVLAHGDAATVFALNAIFALVLITALTFMDPAPVITSKRQPIARVLHEGITLLLASEQLRSVMMVVTISALFVRPYILLLPVFALDILQTDINGLCIMYCASGLGALLGVITGARIGNTSQRMLYWQVSGIAFGISAIFLAVARDIIDALPWVLFAGYSAMLFVAATNLIIAQEVSEAQRGRAVAVYTMMLTATIPLGAIWLAILGQTFNLRASLVTGGLVLVGALLTLYLIKLTEER